MAFTDKLGKRVNFTRKAPGSGAADEKDVYAITLDKKINFQPEYVLGTFFWHIDGVTINQPLPKATLLTARKLSPAGGQTEFASTYAAYENLPEEEKKAIETLKVVHRMEASMRPCSTMSPKRILLAGAECRKSWFIRSCGSTNSGRKSLVDRLARRQRRRSADSSWPFAAGATAGMGGSA